MKAIFLFPGQGAQYPGMAIDFINASEKVKLLFKTASGIIGKDMSVLLADAGPDELKRTDVSQPAITLANLAAAAFLEEKGIKPSACAGFSLGEYAALAAAGVICNEDCFFLVNERGKAMQAAVDRIQSGAASPGMVAVTGLTPEKVDATIAEIKKTGINDLYAANINSQKQVVVSGSAAALEAAEKFFIEAGARRFIRLQVAGPFHSPLMKEAAETFAPFLEKVRFNDPEIPVFSNVTGKRITTGAEAKALAIRHIVEAVRWTEVEKAVIELQPDVLYETGPGKVLQGLWRDTENKIPCCTAGTVENISKILTEAG